MEPRISIVTLGVSDLERSRRFYKDGLGLPTTWGTDKGVVFFRTRGACLALYPYDALAKDAGPKFEGIARTRFPGIALAYNCRTKDEVVAVLTAAEKAGGKIEKPAQDACSLGRGGALGDIAPYLPDEDSSG